MYRCWTNKPQTAQVSKLWWARYSGGIEPAKVPLQWSSKWLRATPSLEPRRGDLGHSQVRGKNNARPSQRCDADWQAAHLLK